MQIITLHLDSTPPATVLKLEDPDVIGNDVLRIIKLQENFYNKNQLGKTEPIYLPSSPSFMPTDETSAAQNNGRGPSTRAAGDACSHAAKFND